MELLKVNTLPEVFEKLHSCFSGLEKKYETINIRNAVGRYLGADIFTDADIPAFARSVVDGYCVISSDTFGASESIPAFLDIVGQVEMGQDCSIHLKPGETAYVPTGGMLPKGADAVVMVEYTELLDKNTCIVSKPTAPGMGVMDCGEDAKKGTCLFKAGKRTEAKDVGMLTSCGYSQVTVCKKPIITVISTGDEIIPPEQTPLPGQVRDINSYAIAALAESIGCEVKNIHVINDSFQAFKSLAETELSNCDILLISGSSSAGNKDMTKDVLESIQPGCVFTHGIALKPGKPTIIAKVNNKPVFGLPGHPVSAITVFNTVVTPFILQYYFGTTEKKITVTAEISSNIHGGEGRTVIQYVNLQRNPESTGGYVASPIFAKSGAVSQLLSADGYIILDSKKEGLKKGELVEVILL